MLSIKEYKAEILLGVSTTTQEGFKKVDEPGNEKIG